MKKFVGDIIILHKCTKNRGHMLYCSRDTVGEECNCYFSLPFYPTNSPKNENFKTIKKEKKYLEISFYTRVPHDHDHMLYRSLDSVCARCNYFFYFIFSFYPPKRLKNQNFKKMKKMPGHFIILHMCNKVDG